MNKNKLHTVKLKNYINRQIMSESDNKTNIYKLYIFIYRLITFQLFQTLYSLSYLTILVIASILNIFLLKK